MFIALTMTPFAWSQVPAAAPATDLGQLFRSRLAGIEFNPPADGTIIRELNSNEVVRFAYPDLGWDVRVKQIPASKDLKLSIPGGEGLLEMTASQLTLSNPTAKILRQEVIQVNNKDVGVIEVQYLVGTDPVYAQQAIFCDNPQHFLVVQMSSRDDAKTLPAGQHPLEDKATDIFQKSIQTVKLLDRSAFYQEQLSRQFSTANLWVLFDRKKVTSVIQPMHLMRVIRDGKDIGFVQVNERLATRNGTEGVEIIVRSRVQNDPNAAPLKPVVAKPADNTGVVLPAPVVPANAAPAKPAKPTNLFTSNTYFVTFGRNHEEWTAISQTDVNYQALEAGYSDLSMQINSRLEKAALQRERLAQMSKGTPTSQPAPIDVKVPVYALDVSYDDLRLDDKGKVARDKGKPADFELPPYYLPQALSQLLPRLLPNDPALYMFAFYVSGERKVMNRYVDVEQAREVVIDGQTVRAVPISDRVGADGIPTVHYVTRQGEWLGSINETQKLQVLPSDEKTLHTIWDNQPLGFKVADEPPPTVDEEAIPDAPMRHLPPAVQHNLMGPDVNGR
jgi:hypothetical protein